MSRDQDKSVDFSKGRHRDMLIWQRRQMWTEETIARYADWLNLTSAMTAVDVGCGLGYLGYTYWKYFGKGGHYIGIDIRENLIKEALESAKSWAQGGRVTFKVGDAYHLPLKDNIADWVMCQTLMIHLEKPQMALGEMIRVLKPGGLIMCIEPDNLRPVLVGAFSSLPRYDIKTQLLIHKVSYIPIRAGSSWDAVTRVSRRKFRIY